MSAAQDNINDSLLDVGLVLSDALPSGFEDEFLKATSESGVYIRSVRMAHGPYAGIELYVPSAVMLFIASSYFGGAIARAGERHFDALTAAVKKLWWKAHALGSTPVGSAGKTSAERRYSLDFSIIGSVTPNLRFKLIIKLDATEEDGEEAIEAYFQLIRDIQCGTLQDSDLEALLTYKPIGGTALVTFDGATKSIVPVNGMAR